MSEHTAFSSSSDKSDLLEPLVFALEESSFAQPTTPTASKPDSAARIRRGSTGEEDVGSATRFFRNGCMASACKLRDVRYVGVFAWPAAGSKRDVLRHNVAGRLLAGVAQFERVKVGRIRGHAHHRRLGFVEWHSE